MIWRTGDKRRTIAVMVGVAYFVVQGINEYAITMPSLMRGFISRTCSMSHSGTVRWIG